MRKNTPLKLLIAGHVDHGKSTLIGRLLADTGSLPEGKIEQIKASCAKRGMPFEWAFLTDALQAERDQNVTIDAAQIILRVKNRNAVLIDAPGHHEFLRNMITGASGADAALIVIDAKEGISEQSHRHGYLLHMLGIKQVAVAVNKMDQVGYDQKRFAAIKKEYAGWLRTLGLKPAGFIPVSAREGDNVARRSLRMKWYKGKTVTETLSAFESTSAVASQSLRFPVQDVYKLGDKRIVAGRVESGKLKAGETLLFLPSGEQAKVATVESSGKAAAGAAVGITLDRPVFVERGQMASHKDDAPKLTNLFRARLFWLGKKPLASGKRYTIRIHHLETSAEIRTLDHSIDPQTLAVRPASRVERGQIAEAVWRTRGQVAVDEGSRFVILDEGVIAGGGLIDLKGFPDQRLTQKTKSKNIAHVDSSVDVRERALVNGHFGGILWFTGLSGAGKSTLSARLQKGLFKRGCQVYVLDGDNIRGGLSRDLGFSPADRRENIRRVAETAALFANAGMIVITAFISPYRADREQARAIAPEFFHEIHIKASLAACEKRDARGLYRKARAGQIPQFTGISAPYEPPETPDLVIDTESMDIDACVETLLRYASHHFIEPVKELHADTP